MSMYCAQSGRPNRATFSFKHPFATLSSWKGLVDGLLISGKARGPQFTLTLERYFVPGWV